MATTRTLGRSGITVGAIGMGSWSIGSTTAAMRMGGQPLGWGDSDVQQNIRAIQQAVGLGITFFDTANVYAAGQSERVLGKALAKVRDQVVIATKWGWVFDEQTGEMIREDHGPGLVRPSLEASLRRLGTDYVDVYQFHENLAPADCADDLVAECEKLVDEGLIRTYGWSTDFLPSAEAFARGPNCSVIQHQLNVFTDNQPMLDLCGRLDLASINRGPLAMGLLSDKVTAQTRYDPDTVRGTAPEWLTWFADGRPAPEFLAKRDAVRDILTSDGRTTVQGALGYILARSDRTVPIPGCRTVAQVEETAGALAHGPLTGAQVAEIHRILGA
ncbi:MAG: aldo/keto reductase [Dactylosporangium sp.]|nr:aldo/keto reductase [Dactylosporangium sp.]